MTSDNTLAASWKLWQECLDGEDTNAIFPQIYRMTLDAAIFRLLLEARRSQIEIEPDDPQINVHLHQFIDRNFFEAQAACMRRVLDNTEKSALHKKHGVYSLGALIKDIRANRLLFTRGNVLSILDLPYDYEKIKRKESEFMSRAFQKANAIRIPPEFDWEKIRDVHVTFDALSEVQSTTRTPSDTLTEKVLTNLENQMDACQTLMDYSNKYIAHSATPESRQTAGVDEANLTLGHLWEAHRIIYQAAQFIAGYILFTGDHAPLVWESPSLFEHWDAPLVTTDMRPRLQTTWETYRQETEQWRLSGVLEMAKRIFD